jgi:hypothetical protein
MGGAILSSVLFAGASLASTGCSSTPPGGESPALDESTSTSAAALTSDAGTSEAGLDCGGGTPWTGLDGGACLGALGQSTFQQAICTCAGITASSGLTTDGYDSTKGAPDGGLGGNVASDQAQTWSSAVTIGGNLQTPANLSVAKSSTVRGSLVFGGTESGKGALTIDGTASVVKTLPSSVKVLGTTTKVSSVASACDCTNLVPTASIVAAHASSNDDATIGLSATAATGASPVHVDLTCGNFYLSQINMTASTAALTVAVHGHAALYVGGNVASKGTVSFQLDPNATLDLFVAGTVGVTGAVTLGSTAHPAQCRTYVSGSTVSFGSGSSIGCNLYAPAASFSTASVPTVYGSLFVGSLTSGATTTLHYDESIQKASSECCTAGSCDDGNPCTTDACNGDGTCSHVAAANGSGCNPAGNLCSVGTCSAGACTNLAPVQCTAADACHLAGTCNVSTGACSNPTAPNGTACNDGNACTQTDACSSGVCTGSNQVVCTASDACHLAGACNASTGACSNPTAPNGTACNDGNACTQTDACSSGVCIGGNAVVCTASDACHEVGTCNVSTGVCSSPAAPDGTACNDGNACTQTDACSSGVCTGGNPVVCAASDGCHLAGTCNVTSGSCSNSTAPDGTACSDGNACTQTDTCTAGTCTGSNPVVCVQPDQCHTAGSCNPPTGQCSSVAIAGCGSTTDAWGPTQGRPTPREGIAAAFAPAANRLVVFGGENAGVSLGDAWVLDRATGLWSTSTASGPGPRTAAAVAFDTGRNRVVVFGGIQRTSTGDLYLADTWELDPVAGAWTALAPASPPPARAYAAAAFDASRQRTVLFGGRGPSGAVDTTVAWEWDGASWTSRPTPGGPSGRSTSAMVFDSARAKVILFGGETAQTPGLSFGDTWELDSASGNWSAVAATNAPPARVGHAMYYDVARAKVVMFGGTSTTSIALGDTWEYDPVAQAWTQRVTASAPSARAAASFSFDPNTGHGLLFGGVSFSSTGAHTPELDDLWELDPIASTWSPRTQNAAPAITRVGAAFDTARGALVTRGAEVHPAMWELASGRWTAKDMLAGFDADYGASFASPQSTGANFAELSRDQSMVYDPARGTTLYLEEGYPATSSFSGSNVVSIPPVAPNAWEWNGSQWSLRSCTNAPPALQYAGVAFDVTREKLVVAGGTSLGAAFQTWEVDSPTCTWVALQPPSSPPARSNPMMAWDSARDVVVLFGGGNASGLLTDTWEWNGPAGTWTQVPTPVAPPGRVGAGMAYDAGRSRVVLFGGQSGSTALGDVWEYTGASGTWAQITPAVPQSPRVDPSLVYDPTRARIEMLAGTTSSGARATGVWEWDGTQWTKRPLAASPGARSGSSGGWLSSRTMGVLMGGVQGDGARAFTNDVWIWNGGEWSSPSAGWPQSVPVMPGPEAASVIGSTADYVPAPRAGHAFAVGFAGSTSSGDWEEEFGLLFGGETDEGVVGDTWTWSDSTYVWNRLPQNGPSPRTGHAMVAVPDVEFFLFGGSDASGDLLGDGYSWTLNDGWVSVGSYGAPPARTQHAMAADPIRGKIVLFGGRGASGVLQDTWEYDVPSNAWTQRTPAFAPPARFGHSMFYDPDRGTVIMVGGSGADPSSNLADAWEWDGQAGAWAKLFVTAGFTPRSGAVGFFDSSAGSSTVFGGLAYGVGGTVVATYGDAWKLTRANELSRNGLACTSGSTCGSGFCVDGVCCNTACTDQCGACNVAGSAGTCTAISGAPQGGRAACSGSGICAASCNGVDSLACHSTAAGVSCGGPTCSGGAASSGSTCDGSGNCVAASPVACGPLYACSGSACASQCMSPMDCAQGATCSTCVDGCSGQLGVCYLPVTLVSATFSPTNPVVGSPVTITAQTSGGNGVQIQTIEWDPANDGGQYFWGSFVPTMSGNYTVVVVASSQGEPAQWDPSITLTVPVSP